MKKLLFMSLIILQPSFSYDSAMMSCNRTKVFVTDITSPEKIDVEYLYDKNYEIIGNLVHLEEKTFSVESITKVCGKSVICPKGTPDGMTKYSFLNESINFEFVNYRFDESSRMNFTYELLQNGNLIAIYACVF